MAFPRVSVSPFFCGWTLKSIIFILGRGVEKTRFFSVIFLYFPFFTFINVSNEGVAEPNTAGILLYFALEIARSRAEYRSPFCCLREESCSSSTIIIPRSLKGVNTPDLVPIIIFKMFIS